MPAHVKNSLDGGATNKSSKVKVILIFVSTLDGKVTKWGNPDIKRWSSHQDQDYYKGVWNESRLIVMGSNTFKADTFKPSPDQQLIIMTTNPGKYKSSQVRGQIDFSNESPVALVARYKNEGYEQMLVIGGPHVATSFLKEQLIDELWLTIEPKIFGTGSNFATEANLDINLHLLHVERANEQGTLMTKYAVLK